MDVQILLENIKIQGKSNEQIDLVKKAYKFAESAHRSQKRKSGEPYINHPLSVASRLADMGLDAETIAAGLLHDVAEDTPRTIQDIEKEFGRTIAFLVRGVTKLGYLKYKGTERDAENMRKMFLAIAEDIRIVLIKLADRLHNMQTLSYIRPEKQKRIALETLEIYAPLANRLGMGELKGQLEDLAFPYVYPEQYKWLMRNLHDPLEKRRRYIEKIKPIVVEALTKEGIKFLDIHARAKHHYSLYLKAKKYDMRIDEVYDLVALRIIVSTVEECYSALGIIHTLWKPVPGLIKDYIALPKPNGYRSLHTTVFGDGGRTVEFQIRTLAMHEEAENGIAAHWAYAEKKGSKTYRKRKSTLPDIQEIAWVQQLREWQKNFREPQEFIEALKIDFFKNRIFALTPKGDVIDLPDGSTPIDFAYHIHSQIGHSIIGAKVNSKMVSLDYRLKNGDVVEILTQKNRKPSPDWLQIVKSPLARKQISSFLKKDLENIRLLQGVEAVEFRISAYDYPGLLRNLCDIFAKRKINIRSAESESRSRTSALVTIRASIKDRAELSDILKKLNSVSGVKKIRYHIL